MVTGHYPSRVPPFGNLRIKAYLQLPEAYRSLSRPSSAISAMASTLRSCSLDLASSRQSSFPKTIENDDQQRLFVVLFLPCAVFKVRRSLSLRFPFPTFRSSVSFPFPLCLSASLSFLFGFDPSKRYRNQSFCLSDSVDLLANFIDTLCRCCLFCKRLCRFFRLPATDVTQLST